MEQWREKTSEIIFQLIGSSVSWLCNLLTNYKFVGVFVQSIVFFSFFQKKKKLVFFWQGFRWNNFAKKETEKNKIILLIPRYVECIPEPKCNCFSFNLINMYIENILFSIWHRYAVHNAQYTVELFSFCRSASTIVKLFTDRRKHWNFTSIQNIIIN